VAEVVKLLSFYGTQKFNVFFTSVRHYTISWSSWIFSIRFYCITRCVQDPLGLIFLIFPCNAICWRVVALRFLKFQLWLSIISKRKHRCIMCSGLECNSTVRMLVGKWRLNREPTLLLATRHGVFNMSLSQSGRAERGWAQRSRNQRKFFLLLFVIYNLPMYIRSSI
jgi:hypothetical protein